MFKNFFTHLKRHSNRWYYLPLVCVFAFLDLFIVVIPTEGMIVMTSVMRPRRWLTTGIAVSLASAAGAFVLAYMANTYGEPFITWAAGDNFLKSPVWIRTDAAIVNYGFLGLVVFALGPLPAQIAVMICALGSMAPVEILSAFIMGRAPKYIFFSWIASKGEVWLKMEIEQLGGEEKLGWLHKVLSNLIHDPTEVALPPSPPAPAAPAAPVVEKQ